MPQNLVARIVLLASVIVPGMLLWDAVGTLEGWEVVPRWFLEWILISVAAGCALVVLARYRREAGFAAHANSQAISDLPATVGHLPRFRQFPSSSPAPFLNFANFALYFALFLMCMMFTFTVFDAPRMPHGLRVRLGTRAAAPTGFAPASETLGVYADSHGKFYFNGSVVNQDQLEARLADEIRRRATSIVYFEADDNIEIRRAILAFDAIKGAGGEIVWITPRLREQWQDPENSATSSKTPRIIVPAH